MKCPHCNQNHPAGMKFCPNTGKKIEMGLNVICRNDNCANYCKGVIPISYRYCPECGMPTETGYRETPYSEKQWSTKEDFKRGDIIANHIMLGGAYPYDYLCGEAAPHKEGSTAYLAITDNSFVLKPLVLANEEGIVDKIADRSVFNMEFLYSSAEGVEWMQLNFEENPLFREIGIRSSNEIANNIDILESLGYLRIKNFLKANPNHLFMASFVSNKPNSIGGYTFIVLFDDCLQVFNDVITEWVSYQAGVVYHSKH